MLIKEHAFCQLSALCCHGKLVEINI